MDDFNEIYTVYFGDVYRYIFSLCRNESIAEDITQETFLKALKNIDKFDGKCRISVWLCQIAKNSYFSYCKKENKFSDGLDTANIPHYDEFEQKLVNKEYALEVHKSLHNLEEPYKEVFYLRLFGELSFAKIGEIFGKTESWARVTYHRARIKIKEDIK